MNGMNCPICGHSIKLRAISPPNNAIKAYPAVRPCPSCRAPLVFDAPQWVIWTSVLLILAMVLGGVVFLDSLGVLPVGPGRRRWSAMPWEVYVLTAAVSAVGLGFGVWGLRTYMKITSATREDEQRYAGR